MKKLILIGMVFIFFTMSGCNYYFEDIDSFKNMSIDEQYWFDDYDSFIKAKDNIKANSDIFYIDKYEEVKTSKVADIDASVVFEDVQIIREKRSNVKIQYIGIFDLTSKAKKPEYTIESGKSFVFKVNWEKLTGKSRGMLLIYLPNDYDGELEVSSVSGDIAVGDLDIQEAKFNAVSGEIDFGEIKAEKISINTVSGGINGNVSDGSYIDIESVSGELNMTSAIGKEIHVESVSGEIEISNAESDSFYADSKSGGISIGEVESDYIEIESVSGEVELKVDEQQGDIKIKTVSGEVVLDIKGKMNTRLDVHSNSGSVSCDYDIDIVDKKTETVLVAKISSGKYSIEIDTVSGSITLK